MFKFEKNLKSGIMTLKNLLGIAVAVLCLAGCGKEKKDDFIIKRRVPGIVRFEGGGTLIPPPGIGDAYSFWASLSEGILSVSFLDDGIYKLYIENELGEIVFSSELPADGQVYKFDISDIDEDELYILVLEGAGGIFECYFKYD